MNVSEIGKNSEALVARVPSVSFSFGSVQHAILPMVASQGTLDWGYPPNRRFMIQYGVTNVPALVIVKPDGTHHTRQGRMTPAQVISFVRGAKASSRPGPPGG